MMLFFTIINNGYKYFATNFYKRLKQINIDLDILFVCTDSLAYNFLSEKNVDCLLLEDRSVAKNFCVWSTKSYKKIVFNKLDVTKEILEKYSSKYSYITYLDTDMWINKNFTNDLYQVVKNNDFDIIFQDGEDYKKHSDECSALDENKSIIKIRKCTNYCTGFMVMNLQKKLDEIKNLLHYTPRDVERYPGNQIFLNNKIRNSNLKVFNLPKHILPNLSRKDYFEKNTEYWMLHYNFLKGFEKYSKMKENNHWIENSK